MTLLSAEPAPTIKFLLTCLLRGMTRCLAERHIVPFVSTHMPLARHDRLAGIVPAEDAVSTHMPLARHDDSKHREYIF